MEDIALAEICYEGVTRMPHDFVQYGQKIQPTEAASKLVEKLAKYCNLAKELGASDAKVISSSDIILDPRVRVKCQYSLCRFYGACANCPPHTAGVDETKQLLKLYNYGILMVFKCPTERIVADAHAENAHDRRELSKVISAVESAAFYDGYFFAVGFGSGPCKSVFCAIDKPCSALEGKGCRSGGLARASMEAVGMDVFAMVTRQGWDIYPIGRSATSTDVPEGTRVGLVLIA